MVNATNGDVAVVDGESEGEEGLTCRRHSKSTSENLCITGQSKLFEIDQLSESIQISYVVSS
jgi:hypothetical protein